ELGQQRITQGCERAGLARAALDATKQGTDKRAKHLGDWFRWRYHQIVRERFSGNALAAARARHALDRELAEFCAPRQTVGVFLGKRWLRSKDDVFSGSPSDLVLIQEVNECRFPVLEARGDSSNQSVTVHEAHTRAKCA